MRAAGRKTGPADIDEILQVEGVDEYFDWSLGPFPVYGLSPGGSGVPEVRQAMDRAFASIPRG